MNIYILTEEQAALIPDLPEPATFADCVKHAAAEEPDPGFGAAAAERYASEGEIEIDDAVVISRGDDGAYVMMWGWIANEDVPGLTDEDEE